MTVEPDDQTPVDHADASDASRPRRRRWRRVLIGIGTLVLLFYGGLGWMFSSKIRNDAFEVEAPGNPEYEVEVIEVAGSSIVLSLESDNHHLLEPGTRGVAWPGGYGQVGSIISPYEETVLREYTPLNGTPSVGELLDMDGFAFPQNPQVAHGIAFETIIYDSDIGPMEAWHVAGSGNSWIIFVHGKTSPLREVLRIVPPLHEAGYHLLAINYRNDVGMPKDPSDAYAYGETEWKDVEGAVKYAFGRGATDVALVGYSMGGGIVTSFMVNSASASQIDAVVLDAPMLDFSATVDLGARNTSLPLIGLPVPQSLTNVAKVLAGWRFGIDWSVIDYFDEIDEASELNTPVLLFHGTEDERVPLATSERFAEMRPDIVQLEIFEDAGHILSWNVDTERYEGLLAAFLAEHLG